MTNTTSNYDVIIVGGGLVGLISAIHLSKFEKQVLLIEKNAYPKHKVCGEYISNEVLPYLKSLGVDPIFEGAKQIARIELTTVKNNLIKGKLPFGGFGMSRYYLDNLLAKKATSNRVIILEDTVNSIDFEDEKFTIRTKISGTFQSKVIIGAFGKRSILDVAMKRKFIQKKSPYLAAKVTLEAITRSIALEFAPYGIRANCIQAGVTDTASLRMIPRSDEIKKHSLARNFFNRLTLPEDVANAVYLLSKDQAAWINGTIIPVDGGEHIR